MKFRGLSNLCPYLCSFLAGFLLLGMAGVQTLQFKESFSLMNVLLLLVILLASGVGIFREIWDDREETLVRTSRGMRSSAHLLKGALQTVIATGEAQVEEGLEEIEKAEDATRQLKKAGLYAHQIRSDLKQFSWLWQRISRNIYQFENAKKDRAVPFETDELASEMDKTLRSMEKHFILQTDKISAASRTLAAWRGNARRRTSAARIGAKRFERMDYHMDLFAEYADQIIALFGGGREEGPEGERLQRFFQEPNPFTGFAWGEGRYAAPDRILSGDDLQGGESDGNRGPGAECDANVIFLDLRRLEN